MEWKDWLNVLRCPSCLGSLINNEISFTCHSCGKTFPVRFGIPDFRLFPPNVVGYNSEEEDLKLSAYLFDLHEKLSFEELVRTYFNLSSDRLNKDLHDRYINFRLSSQSRATRLAQWLQHQGALCTGNIKKSLGLDIGCGTGCGIATLLEIGEAAIGVDITISELILAKSFLKNFYPGYNYFLVAGVAEHLPLSSEFFSNVLAIDVIEHVASQKQFLQEAHRVMHLNGSFYFDTCSRFHWLEPHTRLPGVGYLPRFLQPVYVRLARHRNYNIHLPSLYGLRKWLTESPFGSDDWNIIHNKVDPTSQPKTWRGKIVRAIPGLLGFLKMHSSKFKVIARKRA
jgi:ubiquinone/menaquinone biosynthesis C-methylase UbiE